MKLNARSGLIQTFSNPRIQKPGTPADPRFPAASLTAQPWDKVSAKPLKALPVHSAAEVKARIAPKVRRANPR